jgi:hypothetical protein
MDQSSKKWPSWSRYGNNTNNNNLDTGQTVDHSSSLPKGYVWCLPPWRKTKIKTKIKEEEEWTIESYKLSFPWRQCRQKNKRVERVALFFARFVWQRKRNVTKITNFYIQIFNNNNDISDFITRIEDEIVRAANQGALLGHTNHPQKNVT